MNKEFTYIIRSSSLTGTYTNNLTGQLWGLPTKYRKFKCKVIGFYINFSDLGKPMVEIRSNMPISNGFDTLNKKLQTLKIASIFDMTGTPFSFDVDNFNGAFIEFTLYDDDGLLLQNTNTTGESDFNKPWTLILEMKGIEEAFT